MIEMAELELMEDIRQKTSSVVKHVDSLLKKIKGGYFDTSKGVSFLEMKYQLLLSYLINSTYIFHRKVSGESIAGSVDRLVEIRTVLEKLRPVDQKLKYQINKVLKTAVTGDQDASDPLRFKANPDNFANKLEEEEDESLDEEVTQEKSAKNKIYVPPKLTPMYYGLDETVKDKQTKTLEKAKKRALSSSIMKELRDEYYEGPEEIRDTGDEARTKANKRMKDRIEYEEERMTRITVSKKEKNAAKKMGTISSLHNLTKFGDISILDEETPGEFDMERGKKRKAGGKGNKKKKGFKRRKR